MDDQLSVISEPLGEEEELFMQEEDSCRILPHAAKIVVKNDDSDEVDPKMRTMCEP